MFPWFKPADHLKFIMMIYSFYSVICFLSELVRCSFLTVFLRPSGKSERLRKQIFVILSQYVSLIQASGSFVVHHDDLFIVFRHFVPRVVVPCAASCRFHPPQKGYRTDRQKSRFSRLAQDGFIYFCLHTRKCTPEHGVLVPPTPCFEGHLIITIKNQI